MVIMRDTAPKRSPPPENAPKGYLPEKFLKFYYMYLVITCTKSIHIKTGIFKTSMMYYVLRCIINDYVSYKKTLAWF